MSFCSLSLFVVLFVTAYKKLNNDRCYCPPLETYLITNAFDLFNCYLLVVISLQLFVLEKKSIVFNFAALCFLFFLSIYYLVPLRHVTYDIIVVPLRCKCTKANLSFREFSLNLLTSATKVN